MRISDWSSDVCSSDLVVGRWGERLSGGPGRAAPQPRAPNSLSAALHRAPFRRALQFPFRFRLLFAIYAPRHEFQPVIKRRGQSMITRSAALAASMLIASPALAQEGDDAKGKAVCARCTACNAVDPGVN